jgi:hypothetical protein
MRLEVKKWGNGVAVRLPRESAEYGRLEPGMNVDVDVRPLQEDQDWEPYTFDSGVKDLSQRIDEIAWGYLDEKYK